MKVHYLFIALVLSTFVSFGLSASEGAERFILYKSLEDKEKGRSVGVYLDTHKQQFVTQTIQWPRKLDRRTYSFPKKRSALTSYDEATEDVNIEIKNFPLRNKKERKKASKRLKRIFKGYSLKKSRKKSKELVKKGVSALSKSKKKYKLIKKAFHNGESVVIYYNKENGELVYKRAKGRRKSLFPKELSFKDNNKKRELLENISYSVKTPLDLKNTIEKLDQKWNSSVSSKDKISKKFLKKERGELRGRLKNFKSIRKVKDPHNANNTYEIFVKEDTNELFVRKWGKNSYGEKRIFSEKLFSLNDEQEFNEAWQELGDKSLLLNVQFRASFPEHESCISNFIDELKGFETDGVSNVLDHINEKRQHSSHSLARATQVNKKAVVHLKAFNEEYPVEVSFNKNGDVELVHWLNPSKAKKAGLLPAKLKEGPDGKPYWDISYKDEFSGELKTLFEISTANFKKGKSTSQTELLVKTAGSKKGNFDYSGFILSSYKVDLNARDGNVKKIGRKVIYDGNRGNGYDTSVSKSLKKKKFGLKGAFKGAVFKVLTKKRKLKTVEKQIYKQAKKAILEEEDYRGLISDTQLKKISRDVTLRVRDRTNGFKAKVTDIETIASEEAYKEFSSILIKKSIRETLPADDSSKVKGVVSDILKDFNYCLESATESSDIKKSEACLDSLITEGPVEAGQSILKLKLEGAGYGKYTESTQREYRICIQKNYDGLPISVKEKKGINRVKGCLYHSVASLVVRAVAPTVEKEIGLASKELNISIQVPEKIKKNAVEKLNHCFDKKVGIGKVTDLGIQTSIVNLENLDPDIFEQELYHCVDYVVEDASRFVAEAGLADKLKGVEDLDLKARAKISNLSIKNSYDQCIEIQKQVISERRKEYRIQKKELTRAGSGRVPLIKVPVLDAKECVRFLTNYGVGQASVEITKKLVGVEEWKKQGKEKEILGCYEKVNDGLKRDLKKHILSRPSDEKEKSKIIGQADTVADQKTAQCLKNQLVWASDLIALGIIKNELSKNPEYSNITIGDEESRIIGEVIKSCFKRELKAHRSVYSIIEAQENLRDICGVAILKDRKVQEALFEPIIKKSLEEAGLGLSEKKEQSLAKKLRESLSSQIKDTHTIDGALDKINSFKGDASEVVINTVLEDKLSELLNAPPSDPEFQRVQQIVKNKLFGDEATSFTPKLKIAFESGNQAELDEVIEDLKISAAEVLSPEVVKREIEGLVEKEIFENLDEARPTIEYTNKAVITCLREDKQKSENFDQKLERCKFKAKNKATVFVLNDRLESTLKGSKTLKEHLTESDIESFKKGLINSERLARIESINALPEGNEKEERFNQFILSFKVDAVKKVFDKVIVGVVKENLPVPSTFKGSEKTQYREFQASTIRNSKKSINSCLNEVEKDSLKGIRSEFSIDKCINKTTLATFKKILPKRLRQVVKDIFGGTDDEANKFVLKSQRFFTKCGLKVQTEQETDSYSAGLDSCLTLTIVDVIKNSLGELRGRGLLAKREETDLAVKQCLQDIKKEAYKKVYGTAPSVKKLKMREELYFQSLFKDAKENKRDIGPKWLQKEFIACGLRRLASPLLKEYKDRVFADKELKLTSVEKEVLDEVESSIGRILTTKNLNGENVGLALESFTPKTTKRAPAETKSYIDSFLKVEGKIFNEVGKIAHYDPDGIKKEIKDFEKALSSHIKTSQEDLGPEEVVNALFETSLADIAIESFISDLVKKEISKALKEQGVSNAEYHAQFLAQKSSIKKLFGAGKGKESIQKVKNDYLRPLLLGQSSSSEIPPELVAEIKDVIASDTSEGGFAQRIAGAIIQSELDEKKELLTTGNSVSQWGKKTFANLRYGTKFNVDEDFEWGSDTNEKSTPNPHHLKNTPKGKEAIHYFSTNILRPKLQGQLTKKQEGEATEKLKELIIAAQKQNKRYL